MTHESITRQRTDLLAVAEEALRKCESDIQTLVMDAASASRYDEIDRLTAIARSLNEMAISAASAQRLDRLADSPGLSLTAPSHSSRGRARKSVPKVDYPKFARDGEELVKIGWSKKKRNEYIHRARRTQAESIVMYLAGRGRANGSIPIDDILGLHDRSGAEILGYQVYLTLAWLRKVGLIELEGRNGYVVPDAQALESTFADLWSALPDYRVS